MVFGAVAYSLSAFDSNSRAGEYIYISIGRKLSSSPSLLIWLLVVFWIFDCGYRQVVEELNAIKGKRYLRVFMRKKKETLSRWRFGCLHGKKES